MEPDAVKASQAFANLAERSRKAIEFVGARKRNYQLVFGSGPGRAVLRDLAYFCRADRPTFHADPRIHALLEGRREVLLRIQHHLGLTDEQLTKLYGGPIVEPQQQEGQL